MFYFILPHFPTAVFEKGLEGNLSEAGDYLKLWTAYCDYLRRQVPSAPTPVTSLEGVSGVEGVETADKSLVELRKTFKRARDSLDACEDTSRYGMCKVSDCTLTLCVWFDVQYNVFALVSVVMLVRVESRRVEERAL